MRHAASWRDSVTPASGNGPPPEPPAYSPDVVSDNYRSVVFAKFSSGPKLAMQLEIRRSGRVYVLRSPFAIELEYLDDETVFASHRSLPVHGYGPTAEKAIAAFQEMFDAQWRTLVDKDLEALTPHAVKLREALQHAVERVEPR